MNQPIVNIEIARDTWARACLCGFAGEVRYVDLVESTGGVRGWWHPPCGGFLTPANYTPPPEHQGKAWWEQVRPTVDWCDLALRAIIMTALVGVVVLSLLLLRAGSVRGDERPTETRVDLFDARGNRTGAAILNEKTGRIDRFDTHGRRVDGYGIIDSRDGRVDVFDSKGQRKGSGTTPGSRGGTR